MPSPYTLDLQTRLTTVFHNKTGSMKKLYFFLAGAKGGFSLKRGNAIFLENTPFDGVVAVDPYDTKYDTLENWYEDVGHTLLTVAELPPLATQCCFGNKEGHLTPDEVQAAIVSVATFTGGGGAGAGVKGEGPAPMIPAEETPTLQEVRACLSAANKLVATLRDELTALGPIGSSVQSLTKTIAKAEELKSAMEKKSQLTVQFVEMCAAAGHLKGIEHPYFLEGLAEQLEGILERM